VPVGAAMGLEHRCVNGSLFGIIGKIVNEASIISEPSKKIDMNAIDILENQAIKLILAPQLGGKIAQIIQKVSSRAWLAKHPRLVWQPVDAAVLSDPNAYVRFADFGGWDECCPTIGYCSYPIVGKYYQKMLYDHGDCWCQIPQEILPAPNSVTHLWKGKTLDFELQRTIRLDGQLPEFTLEYTLRSCSTEPLFLLWCAHPLFAIEPGMSLHLPLGIRMTIVSSNSPLGQYGTEFNWPMCGPKNLSHIMPDAGWSCKLVSEPMQHADIVLHTNTGDKCCISWQPQELVFRLGLWLNYHGWSGDGGAPFANIGIEPMIGMIDCLDRNLSQQTGIWVFPTGCFHWQISTSLCC